MSIGILEDEYSEGIGTYGPAVLKNGRLVSPSVISLDIEELQEKLIIAHLALTSILQIKEENCERYVSLADGIAFEAVAKLES